jgi:curved DNA-binding protein CbpA
MKNELKDNDWLIVSGTVTQASPEEGFLLSRLGTAGLRWEDLRSLCPWPGDEAMRHVSQLLEKGILSLKTSSEINAWKPSAVFTKEMKSIQEAISVQNPFGILGVGPQAGTNEIRHRYLHLSRLFHPDRFFRKDVGELGTQLNFIFSEIQKAYAALKNPHEREAMARKAQIKQKPKERTKEELLKTVRNLSPELEKMTKAERYYHEALEHQKNGRAIEAFNSFNLAAQTNPDKALYQKKAEEVRPLMQQEKARLKLAEAQRAVEFRVWDDIKRHCAHALQLDPQLDEAKLLWARAVIELQEDDDFKSAREHLLRVKAKLQKNPEAPFQLARLLLLSGETKAAKKELEEALKRSPQHPGAQKLLKEL